MLLTFLRRHQDKLLGGIFATWLALFWVSYALGRPVPPVVGNRPLSTYPDGTKPVMSQPWLQQLTAWAMDHSPFRLRFIEERNRALYHLAKAAQPLPVSPGNSEVSEGAGGWLFTMDEAPDRHSKRDQGRMADDAVAIARAVQASGRRFLLMPIPDKSAVYPEHEGAVLRWAYAPKLRERGWTSLDKAFSAASDVSHCYLPLWPTYAEAKRQFPQQLLYWEQDTHWNSRGMLLALPLLLERLQSGIWDPSAVKEVGVEQHHGDLMANFLLQPDTTAGPSYSIAKQSVKKVEDHMVRGFAMGSMIRYQSSDPRVIPGRTLLISDSFMEGAEALYAPWFADITFAHFSTSGSPELVEHIRACQTLIFTSAERMLRWRMDTWGSDDAEFLTKVLK